jgi:hypothetical protein
MIYYLFDPGTELYYAMTASVEVETGIITVSIDQTGVAVDPGWVPTIGEPICPLAFYLTYFNLEASQVDGNQFTTVTNAVTRYIERYTNDSWIDESVPEDLMVLAAEMCRAKIQEASQSVDIRLKSESVKNYSYTLNDRFTQSGTYASFNEQLDMFRILPFA